MGMRPTYWVGAFFGEGKGYILMETYTKTATIIFVKKKSPSIWVLETNSPSLWKITIRPH